MGPHRADLLILAPRVGVEPTSLVLIQSQAGPAGRPTGDCLIDGTRLPVRLRAPELHLPTVRASPGAGSLTPVTGWFTEDFTLAELKTLRANHAGRPREAQAPA